MFTIWDNVRTLTVLNLLVALATLIFGFMKRLWLRWSLRDELVIQMRDPSLVQLVPHRRRRRQGHRRKPGTLGTGTGVGHVWVPIWVNGCESLSLLEYELGEWT